MARDWLYSINRYYNENTTIQKLSNNIIYIYVYTMHVFTTGIWNRTLNLMACIFQKLMVSMRLFDCASARPCFLSSVCPGFSTMMWKSNHTVHFNLVYTHVTLSLHEVFTFEPHWHSSWADNCKNPRWLPLISSISSMQKFRLIGLNLKEMKASNTSCAIGVNINDFI